MRNLLVALSLAITLAIAPAQAATVSIACSALGQEFELCKGGAEAWARQTGHEVRFVSTPNSATERLALYAQMMAAQSPDIDVYQIDIIWPGLMADHLIDLAPLLPADTAGQHFPTIIENDTVNGRLARFIHDSAAIAGASRGRCA